MDRPARHGGDGRAAALFLAVSVLWGVPYALIAIALDDGFTAANAGGIALILAGAWLAARRQDAGYGL